MFLKTTGRKYKPPTAATFCPQRTVLARLAAKRNIVCRLKVLVLLSGCGFRASQQSMNNSSATYSSLKYPLVPIKFHVCHHDFSSQAMMNAFSSGWWSRCVHLFGRWRGAFLSLVTVGLRSPLGWCCAPNYPPFYFFIHLYRFNIVAHHSFYIKYVLQGLRGTSNSKTTPLVPSWDVANYMW